jgi:hypothetical protein
MDAPQFVLVKTTSPRGIFGRAGLRFTREWRPLRVADVADLEAHVIDAAILARLEAEREMLAVKPATEAELAELAQAQAAGPRDPATELAEIKARNADLEGRLMRLELAKDKPAHGAESAELAELKARNADLEGRLKSADAEARAKTAELEARLARLESAKPASEAPAPAPAPSNDKKSGK